MFTNLLLDTDSYKSSHFLQYPPKTELVSSYIESRGGEFTETLFFGLQIFLKNRLSKPIKAEDIDEAETFFGAHGEPFNGDGWRHILNTHNGHLPVEIRAVAEGTVVPTHNVLLQICNTDPHVPWLTSYLETALLRAIWYPTTVATLSWTIKQIIGSALDKTSDDPAGEILFKLHDFGARGVSSQESAAIGGCAHLVNFLGSDTVSGVLAARKFYNEPMAGFSIPAAEHSTITSWERQNEAAAYENMLAQFARPGKVLAVVSDSYDIYNAVTKLWGGALKQKVVESGATVVVRPDSGHPPTIVLDVIQRLMEAFGTTVNSKGYHVLPPCVRVIQGDGVTADSIREILSVLTENKIAADNIGFGMGGALLQGLNRDTLKFAMKASAAKVAGLWRDVYKDPVTDPGKQSKRGVLALRRDAHNRFETVRQVDCNPHDNLLVPVFRDGKILRHWNFSEVRRRSEGSAQG